MVEEQVALHLEEVVDELNDLTFHGVFQGRRRLEEPLGEDRFCKKEFINGIDIIDNW